jgi:antitoxin HicB
MAAPYFTPAERAECFGSWAERDSSAAAGSGFRVEVQRLPLADGGGFVATVPELPGCMSDGETVGEARANAADAISCWLAASRRRRPLIAPDPRANWATLQRQAWNGTEHRLGR